MNRDYFKEQAEYEQHENEEYTRRLYEEDKETAYVINDLIQEHFLSFIEDGLSESYGIGTDELSSFSEFFEIKIDIKER